LLKGRMLELEASFGKKGKGTIADDCDGVRDRSESFDGPRCWLSAPALIL